MNGSVEKMITVIVSGRLIGITGRRKHTICTAPGVEFRDIRGYFQQFAGYEQHMIQSAERGIRYAVFVGKENRGLENLEKPTGKDIIRIVPALAGSKRSGVLTTIVGVTLIIVGAIMTYASGGTASPFAAGLMQTGAARL